MKISIIGSRTFDDYELLDKTMQPYKDKITCIVSGGAPGADELGEKWGKENKKSVLIFLPDWENYGKRAGYIRNKEIVKSSDGIIAFWDGKSKGTQHSFRLSKEYNTPLKIIKF